MHVEAIAENLDDRLRILTHGSRSALPRQQTMRATIGWSYDLLNEHERRVFERLSIFAGGCSLDMAVKICGGHDDCGEVFEALTSLVSKSLLTADSQGRDTRYALFESFRQYASNKLVERGEQHLVALRHARAYHELSPRTNSGPFVLTNVLSNERIEQERDNWRAALHWALVERGDILLGQQMVAGTWGIWPYPALEGARWMNVAMALVDTRTPDGTIAGLDFARAHFAWQKREYRVQFEASERAVTYYRSHRDASGLARSLTLAGNALASLDRFLEAKSALLEALDVARETPHGFLVPFILRCLALASSYDRDIVAARRYTAEAISIYRANDNGNQNFTRILWALGDLAQFEYFAGNLEIALDQSNYVIANCPDTFSFRYAWDVLNTAAMCLIELGRYDEAERRAIEVLDLERRAQSRARVAWTLQHLAASFASRPRSNYKDLHAEHARAAKILGFVEVALVEVDSPRSPELIPEYDHLLKTLRSTLSYDQLAALMAAGATMGQDRALELALQTTA